MEYEASKCEIQPVCLKGFMAKINLKILNLHVPILVGGKNFGNTIEKAKNREVEMIYDNIDKEVWFTYNKDTAILPLSNVAKMHPEQLQPADSKYVDNPNLAIIHETESAAPAKAKRINPQVGGPTDHVFAGTGHGKTGQEKK